MSKAAWIVVLVAVAVRLLVAWGTGLGIDESYMVAAASHFDMSYFDHPPVSWWLELAARRVVGGEAPLTVRAPFVAVSVLNSWLVWLLTARLYGVRAAFWAVVGYSVSPVFSLAFGCWVLPDGPLDGALLGAVYAFSRAVGVGGREEPGWWWGAGVLAGVAMLSKYNAALVLVGAVAFLVSDPVCRPMLRGWRPWVAGAVAGAMFLPVVWWNGVHGWQSFHYQSFRAAGLHLHPWAPVEVWAGEALFVGPWLWLPMFLLWVRALRVGARDRAGWLLAMLGSVPIILFAAVGVWSSTHILFHWATPGYLMLFPLFGRWAAGWRRRTWRDVIAAFSGALLVSAGVLLVAEARVGLVKDLDLLVPPGQSPLLQLVDWNCLRGEFLGRDVAAVAALRWEDAGKIGYGVGGAVPVTVLGGAPHEFGISEPAAGLVGRNILVVAMPGDVSAITKKYAPYFKSLRPAPSLVVTHGDAVLLVIPVLMGTDLLRAPPG